MCVRLVDTQSELTDLVEDFDDMQRQELVKWLKFYENSGEYTFIGLLVGPFYDKAGQPTDGLKQIERGAERAAKSLELQVCSTLFFKVIILSVLVFQNESLSRH